MIENELFHDHLHVDDHGKVVLFDENACVRFVSVCGDDEIDCGQNDDTLNDGMMTQISAGQPR